jgi:hypothetical protein
MFRRRCFVTVAATVSTVAAAAAATAAAAAAATTASVSAAKPSSFHCCFSPSLPARAEDKVRGGKRSL